MHCYSMSMIVFVCLTSQVDGQNDRLIVRKDPDNPSRFICDVKYATFRTPKGWQANRSGGNTYAILSRKGETYPKLSQMISIDIGKPVEQTAKETAEAFAKKWGGSVAKTIIKIDGINAYRVIIPPGNKTLRPTNCIIALRNGHVFLLIGGASKKGNLGGVLDELVGTWKWN